MSILHKKYIPLYIFINIVTIHFCILISYAQQPLYQAYCVPRDILVNYYSYGKNCYDQGEYISAYSHLEMVYLTLVNHSALIADPDFLKQLIDAKQECLNYIVNAVKYYKKKPAVQFEGSGKAATYKPPLPPFLPLR